MKKTILQLIFTIFTLFFTLSIIAGTPETPYEIKVKFKSLKNQECYLGFEFGTQKYVTDTTQIDDKGVAVFKGDKALDGGIYLIITKKKDFFEFILTESKVYLETDTGDFIKNTKVIVSDENKVFFAYLNFMQDNYTQKLDIEKNLKGYKEPVDSLKIKPLKLKLNQLDTASKYYRKDLAKNYPNSFFVKILKSLDEPLAREKMTNESDSVYSLYIYNFYQWHFFDNVDFSDKRLLRTPVLENKMDKYLDKLTYRNPDSVKYAAARVIEKSRANDEVFKYVLPRVFNKYASSKYMGQDAIFVYLAEKYYLNGLAYWTDSSQLSKIYDRVVKVKNNLIGLKAPELIMKDTNDKYVSLNQMKSVYTVLIFWDASCGHCKKEVPRLKQIYDSIGNRDSFDVFAVYIGTDIKEWKNFIKEHKLTWVNASDVHNYSNFRMLYDIYSTPVVYILDDKKLIQAKRIAVDQICEIVSALKREKQRNKK
jgi:peroxiredoxin